MSVRAARGVLTPGQGYVCLSCRLQKTGGDRGGRRRYQHSAPGDSNEARKASAEVSTEPRKDGSPATSRVFRDMIRGFIFKNDLAGSKVKGNQHEVAQTSEIEPKGAESASIPRSEPLTSTTDLAQQKLQQKFAAQRREQMLAMQIREASKAGEHQDKPKEFKESSKQHVAAPQPIKPRTRVGKRSNAESKVRKERLATSTTKGARPKALRKRTADKAQTRSLPPKPVGESTVETPGETIVEISKPNTKESPPQLEGAVQGSTETRVTSRKTVRSRLKAQTDAQKLRLAKGERKSNLSLAQSSVRKSTVERPDLGSIQGKLSKAVSIKKYLSFDSLVRKVESKQDKSMSDLSNVLGLNSFENAMKGNGKAVNKEIEKADASKLQIFPIEIDQAPVPRLSYGLERVLFNPGVYQLQDPRSRVYNFDPYLQTIMPIAEFEFNALKEHITSSKDETLKRIAQKHGKRYVGSTSSMSTALAHFHFLLSQWRPINTSMLSKSFPAALTTFTLFQRAPSAILLRWRDGSYAIDADKQFDTANVLSMLGKSMEKLLTLSTEDYERYRKSNSHQITSEEQMEPETFHYSTMGDFLMRSQLDAHDARLPGTGMFDLKTRAVVSIRMNVDRYEHGLGYQIKDRLGEWESYEREYHDMIRAAFLKYSMQVRMGRMDGIFVAFHNIDRIFGFQYISLPEMDSTIHGQWDTSIGDQEFKLSLDLLNKILDKATRKYPETSIRLHFETREAKTPFMYIFAEPVTEEQIAKHQSENEAQVEAFNRKILGLHRGQDIISQEDEEEQDANWENIQADVQDAMKKDELSIDNASKEHDVDNEEELEIALLPLEEGVTDQGPRYTNEHNVHSNEEMLLISTGREGDDAGMGVAENHGEVEEQDREQDDRIDQAQAQEGQADAECGKTEGSVENEGLQENVEESTDSKDSVGEDDGVNPSVDESLSSEPEAAATSESTNEAADATEDPLSKEADEPFNDTIIQELAEADKATSPDQDILAMTLTVRNKVNGKFVLRPVNLTASDRWSIEYSFDDITSQERARALYKACQTRRNKLHHALEAPEEGEELGWYFNKLKDLSAKGKAWRSRIDEEDSKKPTQVLGKGKAQGSG